MVPSIRTDFLVYLFLVKGIDRRTEKSRAVRCFYGLLSVVSPPGASRLVTFPVSQLQVNCMLNSIQLMIPAYMIFPSG